MTFLLAFAAIYYLIGVVGSHKLTMKAAGEDYVQSGLVAFISLFWPITLLWTYIREASR